jgi:8-oxo-dGTP pyrophosphatase MutT (NUDIX family)
VTTRKTKRWVVPKGWPIKGLKPAKSAAREAFEEAGVRGKIGGKAVGRFTYDKLRLCHAGRSLLDVGRRCSRGYEENQLRRLFPSEVIHQAIWLYLRFTLSFRDVEDLLAERAIAVSYETVRR